MFECVVRKAFVATVVTTFVLTTVPVYAQTGTVPTAGAPMSGSMSTQDIMQASVNNPWEPQEAAKPAAAVAPAASAQREASIPFWALAAWVSVGVLLAFGYLLRRRAW